MKWICRLSLFALLMCASHARAVGWGPTDFLIFGAPNFPDRIGVFDQNLSFKGNLFTGWTGLQAMNFDQQGRLVAFNTFAREVRVYDSTGALVGGFDSTTSPMLTNGGDIQIMSNGDYIVGTSANGARVFTPQGTFVRQYGSGDYSSIAVLPGAKMWAGNPSMLTMNVLDTDTGNQIASFGMNQQTRPSYMNYDSTTNTVLCIDRDRDAGGVFERDLNGALLQQFHIPIAQTTCNGAIFGPAGDIFGTTSNAAIGVVEWGPNGSVVRTLAVSEFTQARILWAGSVPEPGSVAIAVTAFALLLRRPRNEIKLTRTLAGAGT
jgi:hypothetical protein